MDSDEELETKLKPFKPPSTKRKATEDLSDEEVTGTPATASASQCEVDDEVAIKIEPQADVPKKKKKAAVVKRSRYGDKENCAIMDEVLGGRGIFQCSHGEKGLRWQSIANAVNAALTKPGESRKPMSGETLRKHVIELVKRHKEQYSFEMKQSGWEPKTAKGRLDIAVADYIGRAKAEEAAKETKKKAKNGTTPGGYEIRLRAVQVEPRKPTEEPNSVTVATKTPADKENTPPPSSTPQPAPPQPAQRTPLMKYLAVAGQIQEEKDKASRELLLRQIEQQDRRLEFEQKRHEEEKAERQHQREVQAEQLRLLRESQELLMKTIMEVIKK